MDADDRPDPDLFTFLFRLSRTVKEQLAPRAETRFLADQLYSLSSILKILAVEGPRLGALVEEDLRDLRELLAALAERDGSAESAGEQDETALRDRVARLASGTSLLDDDDPAVRDGMRAYLRRDLARPYVALLTPSPGASPDTAGGADTAVPDEEAARSALLRHLEAHLREAEGDPDVSAEFEAEAGEGYSAESRIVQVESRRGVRRLAVRIQWPYRPMSRLQQGVGPQAEALRLARAADIPVPDPILAVPDERHVGTPFLVTEFVDGYVPTPWTRDGQEFMRRLAESGGQDFLRDLVAVQSLDWRRSTLADSLEGETLQEHQRRRIERLEAFYREASLRPDPLIEEVLAFLRDRLEPWGELVVVHGDYRPGNIIYDPDTLRRRAIIDWDSVRLGDFHEDIGQLLAWPYRGPDGTAVGLFADEDCIDGYQRLSGRELDRRGVHYYELLASFRRYLGFCVLARSWLDLGGDLRMARAWLALSNDRVQLGRLLEVRS